MAEEVKKEEKKKMTRNEFYSVVLKKVITIPDSKIREENRDSKTGKKRFLVGKYNAKDHGGKDKEYEQWKVVGKAT